MNKIPELLGVSRPKELRYKFLYGCEEETEKSDDQSSLIWLKYKKPMRLKEVCSIFIFSLNNHLFILLIH